MKITIITVCYNSADFIKECIESVLNQTYTDIEYIIIDGNSTDGTKQIIQHYGDKITRFISEPDRGLYNAINKGIRLVNGDIIGFLHSDDTFASTLTLQHIANFFLSSAVTPGSQKRVDVAYGDLVFVDNKNANKIVRYWVSRPFKPSLLRKGWMPAHPTVFMRREVYEKHGLFNTNLKCAADYDYILRVFSDDTLGLCYLPEVITRMRMGGISTGGIRQLINKKLEDFWVLKHNNMPFPLWILVVKNVSKIPQLIFKRSQNTLQY